MSIASKRLSTRVSTASVLIFVPYLRSVSMSFSVSLPRARDQRLGRPLGGVRPVVARAAVLRNSAGMTPKAGARRR